MSRNGEISSMEKKSMESSQYQTSHMEKSMVTELLRNEGFRVTRQRELLIDIILKEECSCCKEIYFLASKQIKGIGIATVYRTISALEKIGALKRKNAYQLCCKNRVIDGRFQVELEDTSIVELDREALLKVVEKGLKQCGYSQGKQVKSIRHMEAPEKETDCN